MRNPHDLFGSLYRIVELAAMPMHIMGRPIDVPRGVVLERLTSAGWRFAHVLPDRDAALSLIRNGPYPSEVCP